MQPLMIVVRQVVSKDAAELSDIRKRPAVCHLGPQRVKERFHVGILIGRAPTRHALRDAALAQAIAERRAQKLTAAVTVKDEAGPRLPPMERGIHEGTRDCRVARGRDAPGQDAAGVLIQDRGQIPVAVRDLEIREVAHPDLIARAGLSALDAIGMLAEPPVDAGGATIHADRAGASPAHAHQAFHASMAEPMAARRQRSIETRAAIGPATMLEDRTHVFEEYPVLPRVRTHRPVAPGVEPRPRNRK